jgi:hypothetical protein
MSNQSQKPRWIALKIVRGFPVEVRGFRRKSEVEKQEREWRKTLNPDYDEAGVLPLIIGQENSF